jgi:hypothetical protein
MATHHRKSTPPYAAQFRVLSALFPQVRTPLTSYLSDIEHTATMIISGGGISSEGGSRWSTENGDDVSAQLARTGPRQRNCATRATSAGRRAAGSLGVVFSHLYGPAAKERGLHLYVALHKNVKRGVLGG